MIPHLLAATVAQLAVHSSPIAISLCPSVERCDPVRQVLDAIFDAHSSPILVCDSSTDKFGNCLTHHWVFVEDRALPLNGVSTGCIVDGQGTRRPSQAMSTPIKPAPDAYCAGYNDAARESLRLADAIKAEIDRDGGGMDPLTIGLQHVIAEAVVVPEMECAK